MREDLCTIQDRFLANKLTLNLDKSVCLPFSKNNKDQRNPCLKELNLPIAESTRFLGITLDSNSDWSQHFNQVTMKIK